MGEPMNAADARPPDRRGDSRNERERRAPNGKLRVPISTALGRGNYRSIARRAGLSVQHVSRTLRGERGASFHVAARIAKAAGVTLDEMHRYIMASPSLNVQGRRTKGDIPRIDRPKVIHAQ